MNRPMVHREVYSTPNVLVYYPNILSILVRYSLKIGLNIFVAAVWSSAVSTVFTKSSPQTISMTFVSNIEPSISAFMHPSTSSLILFSSIFTCSPFKLVMYNNPRPVCCTVVERSIPVYFCLWQFTQLRFQVRNRIIFCNLKPFPGCCFNIFGTTVSQ